jgi:hypothetical protein
VSLRLSRELRAAYAVLALGVYALPMAVEVASRVGHDVEHVLSEVGEMKRRAAAMGVAHLHDGSRLASSARPVGDRFVHAHGGAPHTHDDRVGILLAASESTEERHQDAPRAPAEVTSHLAAAASLPLLQLETLPGVRVEPDALAPRMAPPPPLPPPRA